VRGEVLNINRDIQDGNRRNEKWTYVIYDGILTLDSRQDSDEQREILGLPWSYLYDSGQQDEALTGTWRWNEYSGYSYVFNTDGTGTRGFSSEPENITWSTTETRLVINGEKDDNYRFSERWTYTINNGVLSVENQQSEDMKWSGIFDSMQQDSALLGEWIWEDERAVGEYLYIFNADGSGTRGLEDGIEEIVWSSTDNFLVIHLPEFNHWERWEYTIDGERLTLDHYDYEDIIYHYVRRS